MSKAEVLIYQPDSTASMIEVKLEDETVWLTQAQMAELFQTTRNNITLHIGNVFKEKELEQISVSKDSLLTAEDGKKYTPKFYNLDVIISVGYRVKSQRGTQFRIWANQVLKDYLLNGYVLNLRIEKIENKLLEHDHKFDLLINTHLPPKQGIFFDGQIFDAYLFVTDIIKSARKTIVLIDNYVDESVLVLLSKRNSKVEATLYTANFQAQFESLLK